MKPRWPVLVLVVLAAAGGAGIWYLAHRPGVSPEDWEVMQEAISARADSASSHSVDPAPLLRRRSAEDPPLQAPTEPPPGGPFAGGQRQLPDLGQPGYDYHLLVYVEELLAREEVDAVAVAEGYLRGPILSERVAGAVLLSSLGVLDADTLVGLAAEKDPAVPLNVLGWLQDSGDLLSAEMMINALSGEGRDGAQLMDAVSSPSLSPSGRRALIGLAAGSPDGEGAVSRALIQVAASPEQPLEVRAKATAELRGLLGAEDFRSRLSQAAPPAVNVTKAPRGDGEEATTTPVGHRAWAELQERLTRDLEAPPGLAPAMNQVTFFDLQEWTASGPLLIQSIEIASRIEQVLRDPDARVEPGVAEALAGYLTEAEEGQVLSPEALLALRRIESRLAALAAVEAASTDHVFDVDAPPR